MERLAGEEENIYNNYWNSSQIYPIVDMFIIVTFPFSGAPYCRLSTFPFIKILNVL